MAPTVIGAYKFVVIDPVFVTGVVGRVYIDHPHFAAMRGAQQAQAIEVVALNHQVTVVQAAFRRVALLRHHARQHDVGVQRRVALYGITLPVQTQLLARQVFSQQAAQLLRVEVFQVLQQGTGRAVWCVVGHRGMISWGRAPPSELHKLYEITASFQATSQPYPAHARSPR